MQTSLSSRCPGCNGQTRCVPPDGPSPSNILLIGERPGYWEDNVFNRPFTGDSGRELNDNYLRLAGLDRDMVRITNTVRCRSFDTNRKPTRAEVESCAGHFMAKEVEACAPAVIVLMGGTACSMISHPPVDLDTEHGIPRWVEKCEYFGDWSGWVVPMYHPAAGMHNTSLMIPLLEDWKNFGGWLKGNWQAPQPVAEPRIMKRLQTRWEVGEAMFRIGDSYCGWLPVDTESDESRPFSLQFSPNPQEAYMILTQDAEAITAFGQALLYAWNKRVVMHFAIHDLDELQHHYGWDGIEAVDTMIDSYHLSNLPQGLKPLTYRLTGVRMTSYEDVVVPASKDALENWLAEAIVYVSTEWRTEKFVQLKTKVRTDYVKHAAESVLRRILRYAADSTSDYDPWQEPKKLGTDDEEVRLVGRDWLDRLEQAVGRMPRKSIIHAKLPRAVEYGCSDALYTGHCMIRLKERRAQQQEEWAIAEGDEDAHVR